MTHDQNSHTDMDQLKSLSAACRTKLAEDPCDLAARLALSWHLFFQALQRKHQQTLWNRLFADSEQQSGAFRDALRSLQAQTTPSTPDARRLFRDSLMQAAMVLQLSVEEHQKMEAAKIMELGRMLGENQIVDEVNGEANRILSRVAKAVVAEKREKTRIPHRYREEDDLDW